MGDVYTNYSGRILEWLKERHGGALCGMTFYVRVGHDQSYEVIATIEKRDYYEIVDFADDLGAVIEGLVNISRQENGLNVEEFNFKERRFMVRMTKLSLWQLENS